jgi:hypothetical protein
VIKPLAIAVVLAFSATGAAQAGVCRGAAPAGAAELRGPVLHVLDGERLCVALGPDPAAWVPLRLADAPQSLDDGRGALMAASFGRDVTCRLVGREDGDVTAVCRTGRGSVGAALATPKILRAGQTWR